MKNAVLTMKEFLAQFLVVIYEFYSFIVHGFVKRRRVQHVLSLRKRDFVLYDVTSHLLFAIVSLVLKETFRYLKKKMRDEG